ncbi:hypothetical protein IV203_020296 [Nitzschia inconspicua]|uniref:Uncharacterized protein n=1 Tax=Nitzschia inconspicua TaxID=303405 RepID=A0A9K3K6V5_9STRA|nr:hypothetical protein IV203_020296 [Nitzschia inconspicua]
MESPIRPHNQPSRLPLWNSRCKVFFPSMAVAAQSQQLQHQDQIVIEVLQSRLKEAELRYHQVTESLARQTGVLTDQHRAVLELNSKLENERARRQALEAELERLKRQGAK